MILFTTAQLDQLYENGLPCNQGKDARPLKLILPGTGCAWLLTEIRPQGEQFGYGLSDYGLGNVELGYINLMALSGMFDPWNRHRVRIDQSFVAQYPLSVYVEAAKAFGCITEDEIILAKAV